MNLFEQLVLRALGMPETLKRDEHAKHVELQRIGRISQEEYDTLTTVLHGQGQQGAEERGRPLPDHQWT